jgi:type II secretory pathway component PulM
MTSPGEMVGAGLLLVVYAVILVSSFARIVKKSPRDRGIRLGATAVIVFLCTLMVFRLPPLEGIRQ